MALSGSDKSHGFTPEFVATSLGGIAHSFLLVIESESRERVLDNTTVPPSFSIGGSQATKDPRNAALSELKALTRMQFLKFPDGWVQVHHFIYVLSPDTDEHGWEYRSQFSDGVLTDSDEQWSSIKQSKCFARRRVWMATMCKIEDVVMAKRALGEAVAKRHKTLILEGEIFRRENTPGSIVKTWQKRYIYLQSTCIEIYNLQKSDGGKKLAEIMLPECECAMILEGDHPYAFSISHHSRSTPLAFFDAEEWEPRRRWIIAITYQLALLDPFINFPAFDYGPRTANNPSKAVLLAGELEKQSYQMGRSWSKKIFILRLDSLSFYTATEVMVMVMIELN